MAGTGGGFAGTAQPDKKVDVPFLASAKALYDQRNANVTKDDPGGILPATGNSTDVCDIVPVSDLPDCLTAFSLFSKEARTCGEWSIWTGESIRRPIS